jgi:hypothetical protein
MARAQADCDKFQHKRKAAPRALARNSERQTVRVGQRPTGTRRCGMKTRMPRASATTSCAKRL